MPKFLLKRVDARRGEVAAMIVDAPSAAEAVAKASSPGVWKLHRRVDEDEVRASRAGVILSPTFQVPGGRGGRNF